MKILVTVDCDFAGYDPLYGHACALNEPEFHADLCRTRDLVREETGTGGLFFIHTSPFVRRQHNDLFFTGEKYLSFWREHCRAGGQVGLHPHEDEPDGSAYYYYYPDHIRKVLGEALAHLRAAGLDAASVRCGYCAGNERLFPVLEEFQLKYLHDNMGGDFPEAYAFWSGAPTAAYHPDGNARSKPGNTTLWVMPIAFAPGTPYTGWQALIPEALTIGQTGQLWDIIAARNDGPATLLIHAYAVRKHEKRIRRALRLITRNGGDWQHNFSLADGEQP